MHVFYNLEDLIAYAKLLYVIMQYYNHLTLPKIATDTTKTCWCCGPFSIVLGGDKWWECKIMPHQQMKQKTKETRIADLANMINYLENTLTQPGQQGMDQDQLHQQKHYMINHYRPLLEEVESLMGPMSMWEWLHVISKDMFQYNQHYAEKYEKNREEIVSLVSELSFKIRKPVLSPKTMTNMITTQKVLKKNHCILHLQKEVKIQKVSYSELFEYYEQAMHSLEYRPPHLTEQWTMIKQLQQRIEY
jgi:hypothetical protein